jgi:hypothetical protein
MPHFDDAELATTTKNGNFQPIGGRVRGHSLDVQGYPLQVIRKIFDLSTLSLAGPVNNQVVNNNPNILPFIIVNAFMRIDIDTFTGTSIDFSLGHDSDPDSLLVVAQRVGIGDVLAGSITGGTAGGKGVALQRETDSAPSILHGPTYPVWQEAGPVPLSLAGATYNIPNSDDIVMRSVPTAMTTLTGSLSVYILGFSL